MESKLLPMPKSRKRLEILNLEGEELEDYIQQKEQYDDEVEIERDELGNAGLLPTFRDPNLFAVKCRDGQERVVVLEIMKKYFEYLGTELEFQVLSVSSVDKTKGFIYIEAATNYHIFKAIAGISDIDSRYVKVIPPNDRTQIYEPDLSKKYDLKPFQYVRIKKGLYEGDLGQVVEVQENKNRALIRLVPRLTPGNDNEDNEKDGDDDKEEEKTSKNKKASQGIKRFQEQAKKKIRPPQRIFVPSEFQGYEAKRDFDGKKNLYLYKGQSFKNGLLYKKFNYKNLQFENVNPAIEEIHMFSQALNDKDAKIYDSLVEMNKKSYRFVKGDKVRVIQGDLKSLEGIVIKMAENNVTVRFKDLDELIDLVPSHLVKSYHIGDSVKVVAGKNAGKIGFILNIDDNIARLKVDDLKNEVECFLNDLILADEGRRNMVPEGVKNQMDNYRKFDLILLNDQKTFGIIISVDENSARILDNLGNSQIVSPYQILYKLNTRNNMTKNEHKQVFTVGASAKALEGANKGKDGTIKHIYQDVLFLYNVDFPQTAGKLNK